VPAAAIEPVKLRADFVFGSGPNGVTGQAFVEGTLTFLDVLRCGFLQHREAGGRGDKCGHRKKRACHSVFPFYQMRRQRMRRMYDAQC
jgi:hypothetical protein